MSSPPPYSNKYFFHYPQARSVVLKMGRERQHNKKKILTSKELVGIRIKN